MKIIQASFFWQNDKPGGLGFSFGMPGYDSAMLEHMFNGKVLRDYLREGDQQLGTYSLYMAQLTAWGKAKQEGSVLSLSDALLASYNIIWLVERGLIPNDEFNGYQFVKTA